jgi:beta-xylosidase
LEIGRETFLVPMTWENDWPIINSGNPVSLRASAPGLYQLEHDTKWRDDFDTPEMKLGWYRKSPFLLSLILPIHPVTLPISSPTN